MEAFGLSADHSVDLLVLGYVCTPKDSFDTIA
jgi:hypothetical protein